MSTTTDTTTIAVDARRDVEWCESELDIAMDAMASFEMEDECRALWVRQVAIREAALAKARGSLRAAESAWLHKFPEHRIRECQR